MSNRRIKPALQSVTAETIRAALAHIPASLAREEWARMAMAIKSEYPDGAGFDLFDVWSQSAGEGYDAKATRSTWRSVKASGGVGIGTLLHLAKANGFSLPKGDHAPPVPSADDLAKRAQELAERQQRDQLREAESHRRAAAEALTIWNAASQDGESAYLVRKGVGAHGVRFGADGWLVVPLRDASGEILNVQRIAPIKSECVPDKLFLKGGRKSGLWHLLGEGADIGAVVLVAEGYATAATLHEATGHPVACAFDAGNLVHVAKALRQQFPGGLLVFCGDDDVQTFARSGRNPGREKATAAARAVRGLAVFPAPLPDGASDFNDLHQAAGLDAVSHCIAQAIEAHQAGKSAAQAAQARRQGQTGGGASRLPGGADGHMGDGSGGFDPFAVNDSGVWHHGIDQDGKRKPPEWVCSRLEVEARTRDQDGSGWGYLLAFADPLGQAKQWAMPARMLAGDGGEYRQMLLNMGLLIATSSRARTLLTQYIQSRDPGEFASCTDRIGWHGHAFVLPRETIGDEAERIVFQTDNAVENTFRSKGTAEQWRDRIALLCAGNTRLVFALACAFAGPLLRPAGMESGGFHYRGDSSSGKTTALKLAASVYGGASFLQRWRTTDNALEAIAAQHSDCLLILDELAQVDPKMAGEAAYMLANEQSKARATRTGAARTRLAWRLLFLSAGELGLADHMAEGMKRARTGQEVRMADIPADAGVGLGAFENLHGHEGGAAYAKHLAQLAGSVYGAAGRAWLEWLCSKADTLKARIRDRSAALALQLIPESASGQVERVGARFALVGAAGELATEAGLTGWAAGESERAARSCFNAWLAARGGIGNGEVQSMVRQVRRFLEKHGEAGFTWWHRGADDHNRASVQRFGFRRMLNAEGEPIKTNSQHGAEFGDRMPVAMGDGVSVEYFVLAEAFKSEVCQGLDPQAVCKVLLDHECLKPDKGRSYDCKPRLPGIGLARCYRIGPSIFELEV